MTLKDYLILGLVLFSLAVNGFDYLEIKKLKQAQVNLVKNNIEANNTKQVKVVQVSKKETSNLKKKQNQRVRKLKKDVQEINNNPITSKELDAFITKWK